MDASSSPSAAPSPKAGSSPDRAARVRRRARIGCGAAILAGSAGITAILIATARRPETRPPEEPVLTVRVVEARLEPVETRIVAYGEARPLRVVDLAAEVGGTVVEMARALQAGDRVREDEVLARIDPRDYEAAVAEAEAAVAQARARLAQLDTREAAERERRKLVVRARDLARTEFGRVRDLFERGAGAASGVDAAEQAYVQAAAQLALLDQELALIPTRREEARAARAAAEARRDTARLRLDRTVLRAPFAGRLTFADLHPGLSLQPGRRVAALADDRELEIRAAVDAADLRQWIPFAPDEDSVPGWFDPLPPLPVRLTWTEGAGDLAWTGRLDRVVAFDATTRTATLAVRVGGDALRSPEHPFPLTAGMFCEVEIPGRALREAVVLPRSAITFDGQVRLDVDGRLRTVPVEVARAEGDTAYVTGGLRPGDRVIVTRLSAPLEGARVREAGD